MLWGCVRLRAVGDIGMCFRGLFVGVDRWRNRLGWERERERERERESG